MNIKLILDGSGVFQQKLGKMCLKSLSNSNVQGINERWNALSATLKFMQKTFFLCIIIKPNITHFPNYNKCKTAFKDTQK